MKFLRFFCKSFCFCLLFLAIACGGCYFYVKSAPKITINSANHIILYDQNQMEYFKGSESKEWVSLDEINPYLIQATIYTEDKHFYQHFGFDFLRIGKAFLTNLKNHSMDQGASTITQQYAKNLFLDFEKT